MHGDDFTITGPEVSELVALSRGKEVRDHLARPEKGYGERGARVQSHSTLDRLWRYLSAGPARR